MNIAIIGAGFYGLYLADKLSNFFNVTVYEKTSFLFSKASINNQNRLHLGFHYPRSKKTISQTIKTYDDFLFDFSDSVRFVRNNIYSIHKDSKVNFDEYIEAFRFFPQIKFSQVNFNDPIWSLVKNRNNFCGAVRVQEGIIDSYKLKDCLLKKIMNKKNIKIFCNHKIDNNNINEIKNNFDYVINCTYNEPSLGLKNTIRQKNEVCLIVTLQDKMYNNFGFTIMDGNFSSLYPLKEDIFTLSSVLYTPFDKKEKSFCLNEKINNIVSHGQQYFYLENSKVIDYSYGIKTKILDDFDDQRYSFINREENVISIFSGKISSIIEIYKEVINVIS